MVSPTKRPTIDSPPDVDTPCDTEQGADASGAGNVVYIGSASPEPEGMDDDLWTEISRGNHHHRSGPQNPVLDAVLQSGAGTGPGLSRTYVLVDERGDRAYEIEVEEGHRVTYGPMAPGGKFPSCFRVYDKPKGGECVCAITGITAYYRKDLKLTKAKA